MLYMLLAPSSAPHQVEAVVGSSTEIHVSWEQLPKSQRNGIVTHYTVYYRSDESDDEEMNYNDVETTSLLLRHLTPYTTYGLSVSASTNVGEGPLSDVVTVTTDEASMLTH